MYEFQLVRVRSDTKFKRKDVVKAGKKFDTINFQGLPEDLLLKVPKNKKQTYYMPLKQFVDSKE